MCCPGRRRPLLGTDSLGRDVLSRLLYGILPSLQNSLIALVVFLVIGVPIGIVAGYRGGLLDTVLSRIAELVLSIPRSSSCWSCSRSSPRAPTAAMITLGVLGAPGLTASSAARP